MGGADSSPAAPLPQGNVPLALHTLFPAANISKEGWLDVFDPLFDRIQVGGGREQWKGGIRVGGGKVDGVCDEKWCGLSEGEGQPRAWLVLLLECPTSSPPLVRPGCLHDAPSRNVRKHHALVGGGAGS